MPGGRPTCHLPDVAAQYAMVYCSIVAMQGILQYSCPQRPKSSQGALRALRALRADGASCNGSGRTIIS